MSALLDNMKGWWSKALNLPILQKNRWPWVDYLKGLAIILVVYRHVLIGIERSGVVIPNYLVNANMIFYSFRMPLFFILSGLFINSSLVKRSLKQIIGIKFENLLYPYLIWSFIQITLQIVLSRFTNSERTVLDYTYILYQPRQLDQFWYLAALFNCTVVFLLFKTKVKPAPWLHLSIGLLFYFASHYLQQISMLSDWMEHYLFFVMGDVLAAFFFKDTTQRFLKKRWLLPALIPLFIVAQVYYLSTTVNHLMFLVIALIGCVTMFALAFRMQQWNALPLLKVFGYHSLYIYVMHVLVAAFVRTILTKFLGVHNVFLLLGLGIVFSVVIPVIVYNLLIHEKPFWFLFSYRRKKTATKPSIPAQAPAAVKMPAKY
jgi:fucose 4-O-acetylase-like acetyltransferase